MEENPFDNDFYPVALETNANVVATAKGRKLFLTLEWLAEVHEKFGSVSANQLVMLAGMKGDIIKGLNPESCSIALVARGLSKEEALKPSGDEEKMQKVKTEKTR